MGGREERVVIAHLFAFGALWKIVRSVYEHLWTYVQRGNHDGLRLHQKRLVSRVYHYHMEAAAHDDAPEIARNVRYGL